jgi:hypothetical protein
METSIIAEFDLVLMSRLEALLKRYTAFRTLTDLQASMSDGYVPTIFTRALGGILLSEPAELVAGLVQRGIAVWTNTPCASRMGLAQWENGKSLSVRVPNRPL